MKVLFELTQSPVLEILLKWTVLLALGWAAHGLLLSKDARWRLILWRGIFCFGLALPIVQLFPVSVVQIPIHDYADNAPVTSAAGSRGAARDTMEVGKERPIMATVSTKVGTTLDTEVRPVAKVAATIPWRTILITIWAVGGICGAIRLVRWMVQLSVLKRNARPAGAVITELASEILQRLRVRRAAQVLVSDSAVSPFVFGVFKPTIMLPGKLVESLSQAEAAALLGHEIAHLRQNDLFWCVGWRWMKAVFWFHPLVWKIPAAHNLACEEEADRMASCQMGELASYPRILAQLALRVLDIPKVETQLTANGTAQITQRLRHLGLNLGTWKRNHTYAACGMVLALVLVSAGCKFTQNKDGEKAGKNVATIVPVTGANGNTFKWSGKIIDATGKPVAGATVEHWRHEGALYLPHDPELKKQTMTGADGTFEFQVSHEYGFLLARKTGMAPAWQLLSYKKDSVPATKQTMVMTLPGTLAGTVVDESNKPVTNTEVFVEAAFPDTAGVDDNRPDNYLEGKLAHDCFSALTDAAGRFRIENFPTNAIAGLAIKLPGKALHPGPFEFANPNTARYRAGQKDIQLRVEEVSSIEGKVIWGETNQTLPLVLLQLQAVASHYFATDGLLPVQANSDNTFRINDVSAGAYHLQATFGTNATSDWVAEQVTVSVKAGQTNRGLEVIATHGGMLEVVVLGKKDHKPQSEFHVNAYKHSYQSDATTDSNGIARLRLSPGDYQVSANHQTNAGYQRSAKVETGRTNRIEIEVTHPNKISGIVRMPDGKPAAGVAVRIIGGENPGARDLKTDANGKFEQVMNKRKFGLSEVKMYLFVRDVEHNLAVAQEIEEDSGPFDLKLAPAMTLAGRAESGGSLIPNVTAKLVFWTDQNGVFLEGVARTNTPGRYEIPALPPGGKYGVVVAAPGYGEKHVPEFKAATKAIRQELETVELKPANLRLAGQVLDADDKPVANFSVNLSGREQPFTRVRTDREGRFNFEHTCEGFALLTAYFNNSGGSIEAKGGETKVVLRVKPMP